MAQIEDEIGTIDDVLDQHKFRSTNRHYESAFGVLERLEACVSFARAYVHQLRHGSRRPHPVDPAEGEGLLNAEEHFLEEDRKRMQEAQAKEAEAVERRIRCRYNNQPEGEECQHCIDVQRYEGTTRDRRTGDIGRRYHDRRADDREDAHDQALDKLNEEPMPVADNWKHRGARMQCRTCMFYVPKQSSPEQQGPTDPLGREIEVGRCRESSPTMKGFPVAHPTDWCGSHRLDENKL